MLAEKSGFDISDEQSLMNVMTDLSVMKQRYDKVAEAIEQVNESGYGIVAPTIDDLTLEEPEIVKQAGGYGVRPVSYTHLAPFTMSCSARSKTACRDITFNAYGIMHIKRKRFRARCV